MVVSGEDATHFRKCKASNTSVHGTFLRALHLGLNSYNHYYAKLPQRYGYLTACNREIAIEQDEDVTKVLFFTYRGIIGEVGGYLYLSDGLLPQYDDFEGVGAGDLVYWQMRPNWYYIYRD